MAAVYNIVIKLESNWVKEFGCYTSVILLKKKFKESYFGERKSIWKIFMGSVVIKQKGKLKQSLALGRIPDMGTWALSGEWHFHNGIWEFEDVTDHKH